MKNTINILAFLFVMISTTVLANNEAPSTTAVISGNHGIYKVIYQAVEVSKVTVSIYSEKEGFVFSEVFSGMSSFIRPYNFAELAEGEYKIVVEDKNGRSVEKVNYKLNAIESVIQITKLATDNNKYLLSATSNGIDEVQVRIYDNFSNLLHEQTVTVNGKFDLVYDLKQTNCNNPSFEVVGKSGDKKVITY